MSGVTDETQDDVSILNQLFDHCDVVISGQVKANDLITRVREVWPQNCSDRESKVHLNDLVMRLDPKQDNGHVNRETFVKCGLEWLEYIRSKLNNNASLSASTSSINLLEISTDDHVNGGKKLVHLDATFGSIEAINGASFMSAKASVIELQEEICDLKAHIKNVTDEKFKSASLLIISEDSNAQLKERNDELVKRLEQMKKSLDQALQYQKEVEELKSIAKSKEEERDVYEQAVVKNNSRLSEVVNENIELQSKLDETSEKLCNALNNLTTAKKTHCLTMEKLKQDNDEMKTKLNESLAIKVQLEGRIEELKSDVNSMRESQFFQRTPSIFEFGESEFLSPSFDDDPFGTNKMIDDKAHDHGPTANSTPFLKRLSRNSGVRGSISDEIKVMGVREMTPFCEKSTLHDDTRNGKVLSSETGTQTPVCQEKIYLLDDYALDLNLGMKIMGIIFLLGLVFFTFFGAIEFEDGRKLFPIFWSSGLPEPVAFLSIKSEPAVVW